MPTRKGIMELLPLLLLLGALYAAAMVVGDQFVHAKGFSIWWRLRLLADGLLRALGWFAFSYAMAMLNELHADMEMRRWLGTEQATRLRRGDPAVAPADEDSGKP